MAKTFTSPLNFFVASSVGITQSIKPAFQRYSPEDICVYDYRARATTTQLSGGGTIGVEITLPYSYWYAIDVGLNYYQSGAHRINGILSQGIDVESTSRYNYTYVVDSQQVFLESRFLFRINTFSPYLSVGIGEAFNNSKSYHSSVPEFIEFTPNYANHNQKKLAYSLGMGLDLPLGLKGLRLSPGYRFIDAGVAKFGNASIDDKPLPFTLKQSFKTNQFILQISYVFPY